MAVGPPQVPLGDAALGCQPRQATKNTTPEMSAGNRRLNRRSWKVIIRFHCVFKQMTILTRRDGRLSADPFEADNQFDLVTETIEPVSHPEVTAHNRKHGLKSGESVSTTVLAHPSLFRL